jgi:hypothetical protein
MSAPAAPSFSATLLATLPAAFSATRGLARAGLLAAAGVASFAISSSTSPQTSTSSASKS